MPMASGDDGTLAGWHHDPSGRHELRFWDGDRWTEHVIDEGIPGLDHPTRSGNAPGNTAPTPTPPAPNLVAVETPDPVAAVASVAVDPVADHSPAAVSPAAVSQAVTPTDIAVGEPTPAASPPPVMSGVAEAPRTAAEMSGASDADANTDANTDEAPEHELLDLAAAEVAEVSAAPITDVAPIETIDTNEDAVASGTETPIAIEPEVASVSAARDAGSSHTRSGRPSREPRPHRAPSAMPIAPTPLSPSPAPATPPAQRSEPTRVIAEPPTVASPAGNSAGANTSAIADPHRVATHNPGAEPTVAPRVAGVGPAPVKRFRPGSPPPSPFAGPRALAAAGSVTIAPPVVARDPRPAAWIVAIGVLVVAAIVTAVAITSNRSSDNGRLGARPPAAAPFGSKVIDGDGFGIAVPNSWIVANDPGGAFPQLERRNWGTPLAATDVASGQAIVAVPLHDLDHEAQVDPELFWSDQVRGAPGNRSITPGRPLSVHGFRANQVTVTDPSGTALVAASIDTGDTTFLVGVTARTEAEAGARFERLIQTFDAR